ncbi:MAG: phosphate--AMP phosphotransferase, partial [Chitinivibrionales bacterium]|nr:phosphate--AMP phosphotransferase [Chitinivibrionales bacterium]
MLANIDLSRKVSREDFKKAKDNYEIRLGQLQRKVKEIGLPVAIVFEGWEAAGKGTLVNELILPLDPRGFKVHSILPPNEEESLRPFLWRFWIRTPADGRIIIFDRSWCRGILNDRVEGRLKEEDLMKAVRDIRSFERQLSDDGTVIIKFFLHISKSEQKKRFNKLLKNQATAWRVSKKDLARHKQYDRYLDAAEDMLVKTDSEFAPWTVIESHNHRFAALKMFSTVIDALESGIHSLEKKNGFTKTTKKHADKKNAGLSISILDKVDTSLSLERDKYRKLLKKKQK